jgi:hypothetical protein
MHKDFIKNKYKKFLDKNFSWTSDKQKASEVLSKANNDHLDLIINKSSNIIDQFSSDEYKIKILKIFSNSSIDKIHSLSSCADLLKKFTWESNKKDLFNDISKITDPGHIYAVSLAKDLVSKDNWEKDNLKSVKEIIFAKNVGEAFSIVGYDDTTYNAPYLDVINPYYEYQTEVIYPVYQTIYPATQDYQTTYYPNYNYQYPVYNYPYNASQIAPSQPVYVIDDQNKKQPVIHNHYNINDNSGYTSDFDSNNDSSSLLSGLTGLAAAGAAAAGIYYLTKDDGNTSTSSSSIFNNASAPLDYSSYDDLPSYSSLYPDLGSFKD